MSAAGATESLPFFVSYRNLDGTFLTFYPLFAAKRVHMPNCMYTLGLGDG
jgi:hypothetical protein